MMPSTDSPRPSDLGDLGAWVETASQVAATDPRIEEFEVRGDHREDRRAILHNGRFDGGGLNRLTGLGIRVFAQGGVSYAYANALTQQGVRDMVDRATRLAVAGGRRGWDSFKPELGRGRRIVYQPDVTDHPARADPQTIHSLLKRAAAAAQVRPQMTVQAAFGARTSRVVRADSSGSWTDVGSLLSTLMVQTVVREGGRIGDGTEWEGGERGVGDYEDDSGPEALGKRAGELAVESLQAASCPAGRQRVLCDNHLTGLLTHESFGHLTEYDLVASGWSTLQGHEGERLASDNVTVRDVPVVGDGRRRGVMVPYDDEGTQGRPVTVLDKGVLRSWMHTRDSAASTETPATGNARALDTRFAPIVRMRNTYMDPGDRSLEEAFEQLGDGVYLIGARGGMPRSDGSFMFTSKRGYLVENGEIKRPVRPASIQGNVLDFLKNIEVLTKDHEIYTNYFGGCGKWDQAYLHVGTGGPHVLVSEALVGGQGS